MKSNNIHSRTKQVKLLADKWFITQGQALANGQRIEIRGFGSFSLEARHIVYFRAGKELAKRVDFKNN